MNTFPEPPDAVDLGCGDFNVGRQIRNATAQYIACDIVPDVIDYNRLLYSAENVDFQVLDMISEALPVGDVVFIRQVLQHLRNDQISRILTKLHQYRWAIITEHIPFKDPFMANRDYITGGELRMKINSGVEPTKAPFNLIHYNATVLCELIAETYDITVPHGSVEGRGRIRTTAYRLQME